MLDESQTRAGVLAAVSVSLIWGLSFVAASMVLKTLSPITLATLRFILATLLFSPILLSNALKGTSPNTSDLKEMALLGFLSISLYFWLQYTGVKYAGAGISAILVVGFIPILTGVASSILLHEALGRRKLLGAATGFLGVAMITLPKLTAMNVDTGFLFGVACLLGNAVCWSLYSTLSRRLMQRIGRPAYVTSHVTLFGALFLIPLSVTSDWGALGALSSNQWLSVLYLAVVCSGGGYLLWNFALSRLESVRAAIWLYLEPVAAFVGEAVILGTLPDAVTAAGGVFVLLGAVVTSLTKK
jgi:drug/metabolite transporter (DMT)-like permease